jgi:hypothetical protein
MWLFNVFYNRVCVRVYNLLFRRNHVTSEEIPIILDDEEPSVIV